MLSLRNILLLVAFTCGLAHGTKCHAQVDQLLYQVYTDGSGNYLYDASYWIDRACTSPGTQEYVWFGNLPTPETCAQAQPATLVLTYPTSPQFARRGRFRSQQSCPTYTYAAAAAARASSDHALADYFDPNNELTGMTQNSPHMYANVYSKNGAVGLVPQDSPIIVKIFNKTTPAPGYRTVKIAFEVAAVPAGEAVVNPGAPYLVTKSTIHPRTFSGNFDIPAGGPFTGPIFVATKTQLFK